eukprot:scaffold534_cov102-Isochrysis_galbana.AAC.7
MLVGRMGILEGLHNVFRTLVREIHAISQIAAPVLLEALVRRCKLPRRPPGTGLCAGTLWTGRLTLEPYMYV